MRLTVILFGSIVTLSGFANDGRINLKTDELTENECGARHFAYPAAMLPTTSWRKIMETLENHFGEDASLDTQTMQAITTYLVANAGDTKLWSEQFVRGLDKRNPPIRITEPNIGLQNTPQYLKKICLQGLRV